MAEIDFEYIERYLNKELSSEDVMRFEQQLQEDEALRRQVAAYAQTVELLDRRFNLSKEEQDLRATLKEKAGFFHKAGSIRSLIFNKYLWASAVFAAAIVLFIWAPWQTGFLERYGQLKMTSPVVRGSQQELYQEQIASLFNTGNYKTVFMLLDSAVKADPLNSKMRFFRGITYMHLNKNEAARQDLRAVFNGASIYKYKSAYFMALTFQIEHQNDSSRIWLRKIPESAAIYPKASALFEDIKKGN